MRPVIFTSILKKGEEETFPVKLARFLSVTLP
jgi:hypothetical protein